MAAAGEPRGKPLRAVPFEGLLRRMRLLVLPRRVPLNPRRSVALRPRPYQPERLAFPRTSSDKRNNNSGRRCPNRLHPRPTSWASIRQLRHRRLARICSMPIPCPPPHRLPPAPSRAKRAPKSSNANTLKNRPRPIASGTMSINDGSRVPSKTARPRPPPLPPAPAAPSATATEGWTPQPPPSRESPSRATAPSENPPTSKPPSTRASTKWKPRNKRPLRNCALARPKRPMPMRRRMWCGSAWSRSCARGRRSMGRRNSSVPYWRICTPYCGRGAVGSRSVWRTCWTIRR
mmetsp:Transcript_36136/g.61605  ORF Transcript_36136/g.61605 Transcript_36136/m.61605 type:complete len:290 (+) Transcript_36136:200-1069(+)